MWLVAVVAMSACASPSRVDAGRPDSGPRDLVGTLGVQWCYAPCGGESTCMGGWMCNDGDRALQIDRGDSANELMIYAWRDCVLTAVPSPEETADASCSAAAVNYTNDWTILPTTQQGCDVVGGNIGESGDGTSLRILIISRHSTCSTNRTIGRDAFYATVRPR